MRVFLKLLCTVVVCAVIASAHSAWLGIQAEHQRTAYVERAEVARAARLQELHATDDPVERAIIRMEMQRDVRDLEEVTRACSE